MNVVLVDWTSRHSWCDLSGTEKAINLLLRRNWLKPDLFSLDQPRP
jgi:hypothetical protein